MSCSDCWAAVDSNQVPPRCFGLSGVHPRVGASAKRPGLSGLKQRAINDGATVDSAQPPVWDEQGLVRRRADRRLPSRLAQADRPRRRPRQSRAKDAGCRPSTSSYTSATHSPSSYTSRSRGTGRSAGRYRMVMASRRHIPTLLEWRFTPKALTKARPPLARRSRVAAPGEYPPSSSPPPRHPTRANPQPRNGHVRAPATRRSAGPSWNNHRCFHRGRVWSSASPNNREPAGQGVGASASSKRWWAARDSNPDGSPHTPLKRARLPVPPAAQLGYRELEAPCPLEDSNP